MQKRLIILFAVALLGACKLPTGVFEPACVAFAGDRITLAGERFTWNKFTDVRRIDDAGNLIDPYPDYPKSGTVERDDMRLTLRADDGSALREMHLHAAGDAVYLLTIREHADVQSGQPMPECALKRRETE